MPAQVRHPPPCHAGPAPANGHRHGSDTDGGRAGASPCTAAPASQDIRPTDGTGSPHAIRTANQTSPPGSASPSHPAGRASPDEPGRKPAQPKPRAAQSRKRPRPGMAQAASRKGLTAGNGATAPARGRAPSQPHRPPVALAAAQHRPPLRSGFGQSPVHTGRWPDRGGNQRRPAAANRRNRLVQC